MSFDTTLEVLKTYLEYEGYVVKSQRETVKKAFQIGLIEDGHICVDTHSNRNLTTHTYDK